MDKLYKRREELWASILKLLSNDEEVPKEFLKELVRIDKEIEEGCNSV